MTMPANSSMSPVFKNYDPEHDAGAVPSPCIGICNMNKRTGLCEGCFRTIDEITQWSSANEAHKKTVWVEIKRRQESIW